MVLQQCTLGPHRPFQQPERPLQPSLNWRLLLLLLLLLLLGGLLPSARCCC
jgi:hypothetical protein